MEEVAALSDELDVQVSPLGQLRHLDIRIAPLDGITQILQDRKLI